MGYEEEEEAHAPSGKRVGEWEREMSAKRLMAAWNLWTSGIPVGSSGGGSTTALEEEMRPHLFYHELHFQIHLINSKII